MIKKTTLLVIFCTCSLINFAQNLDEKYTDKVHSMDAIISNLYGVISGEKGEARNWELMRYLFHPDAKLIPSGPNQLGEIEAHYMTAEDYIENGGEWLVENGFFEIEIHREFDTFGSISQVFSTYESYHSKSDKEPFMRGINSIQLLNDGTRWWILNIYWSQESKENPIPEHYLPKK